MHRFTIAVRPGPRQNERDARSSDSRSLHLMRRFLAAALLALAMAGYASADYLLIVINLNAKRPTQDGDGKGGGLVLPPMGGGGGPMPPASGGGPMPPMG